MIEIKCPYSAKNKALRALIEEHSFFLEQLGTVTALKKDHALLLPSVSPNEILQCKLL